MARDRRRAWRRGLAAETVATWYLRLKGYRILERRYRVPAGEIDIIGRRSDTVAFIEVKARRDLATAIEAVTPRARRRIAAAARIWLAQHPAYGDRTLRFDIIAVPPRRPPVHVINAFEVDF